MTWLVASLYVVALGLLLAGTRLRVDPRLRRLLVRRESRRQGLVPSTSVATRFTSAIREGSGDRAKMAAAVPDLLDVLAVSVTAGLSPRLALDRFPGGLPAPLAETLSSVRHDASLGKTWHQALEQASPQFPELRRLANTLRRAERLGSPIAERLRDLASEVRAERRARREERARRAPVQMLFPLVFLILPAFVLAAVVPALLVATRDLI